jgi:allophanate hydrolase subunit 1
MKSRYSFGGDEHIFVECDKEMSLEAFFKSLSVTTAVKKAKMKGVTEICPANASFQIKFDPDVIAPDDMLAELKRLDREGCVEVQIDDQDPDNRDSGSLQRSLDARDADAVPRAAPGSQLD